jgi:hypothetical protein
MFKGKPGLKYEFPPLQYIAIPQLFLAIIGSSPEAPSQLDTALEALGNAARTYRERFARPAVLVIDDAERLQRDGAEMEALLDAAGHWADEGVLRAVFISSDDAFVRWISGEKASFSQGLSPPPRV